MKYAGKLCACAIAVIALSGCSTRQQKGEQRAEVERCGSYLRALGYISYSYAEDQIDQEFPTDPGVFLPEAHLLVVEGMDDAVEFTTGVFGPEHTHYGLVSGLVYPDDFGRVYMFCKTSHPGGKRNVLGVSTGSYFDTVSEEELDRLLETTLREARAAGRDAKVWGTPFTPTVERPPRTYTSDIEPGHPDLSPVSRAATAAISIATSSDPDLAGHGLDIRWIGYEHKFSQPDRQASIAYEAVYTDSALPSDRFTSIDIEVRDGVAYFKTQKGQPLWSCALDGQPSVPENAIVQIALEAFRSFWPKIKSDRLSLDEIACCDPGSGYRVVLRLAARQSSYVGELPAAAHRTIGIGVSPDGTVREDEVRWTSPGRGWQRIR